LLIAVVSTALAWRSQSVHRHATIAIWLLVVYFWGMTTLVLSIYRYMVPAAEPTVRLVRFIGDTA
jgi:hypothetical protein